MTMVRPFWRGREVRSGKCEISNISLRFKTLEAFYKARIIGKRWK